MDELDEDTKVNQAENTDTQSTAESSTPVNYSKNKVTQAINKQTIVAKTDDNDTLINVHIGNPLKRITEILEDIKKQKAFSFTLKGSLGIMGVVLTLSLLGFFGTTHALCDKGVQTHIGRVKVLQVTDTEPDHLVAKIQRTIKYFSTFFKEPIEESPRYRYVLEMSDYTTIHLNRGRDAALSPFKDQMVYTTGIYDSCSRQITVETPEAIEVYK